ncbi:MAG: hypothetical protein WA974_00495 [Thermodesulfobacteriota bacterium]
MLREDSKTMFGNKMWTKVFVSFFCLILVLAVLIPSMALSSSDRLVDEKEYKDKDFHKGIITDYTDMVKGDDVDWVWVKPGENLSQYKIKVGTLENKSDTRSKSLSDSVKRIFTDYFSDYESKGSKGTLTAELCITEVQEYSQGKAWIPFTGGRLAQAGIGIEMVLRDSRNEIIAKLRHFDRRGSDVRGEAEDVASHMVQYISRH